jgi:hypothetical protein
MHPAASNPVFEDGRLDSYLARCGSAYVQRSSPRRFAAQMKMFHDVAGTEDVSVAIEDWVPLEGAVRPRMLTVAASNVAPKLALERLAKYVTQFELEVLRVHLDVVQSDAEVASGGSSRGVTMMRLLLGEKGAGGAWSAIDDAKICREVQQLKWMDDFDISFAIAHPGAG